MLVEVSVIDTVACKPGAALPLMGAIVTRTGTPAEAAVRDVDSVRAAIGGTPA